MNYAKILKRSWEILWSYKTLWIFGIILALTTSSGFNGSGNNSVQKKYEQGNYSFNFPSDIRSDIEHFFEGLNQSIFQDNVNTWIAIAIGVVVFLILLSIVFAIGRYVSQTALIKMVDTYESTGEKVTWKQGFRLGWSREAWRLFLINLVIFLPLTIIAFGAIGCAFLPMMTSWVSNNEPSVPGVVASMGLVFLILFVVAVIAIVISIFMEIIYRECVLKGNGVIESIRNGWKKVTRNLKDVFLMLLILIGVRIGYFLVSIPIILLLLGIALMTGGGIGVAIYFIINAISTGAGWIAAAIVGGFLFLVIFSIPKLFLDGLFETYHSSVWTLTYRELNGVAQEPISLPEVVEKEQKANDEAKNNDGEKTDSSDDELPSPI